MRNLKKQFSPFSDKLLLNGEFYEIINGEEFSVNPKFKVVFLPDNNLSILKRWLKNQLREELDFKVRLFASILGVKYRKIYIRFQRTKWASCSKKGNLSFNLMLMALPESLRDYIIIHELTHMKIQRHGSQFWGLIGEYYPEYKEAEKKLKTFWLALEWNKVWKKLRETKA